MRAATPFLIQISAPVRTLFWVEGSAQGGLLPADLIALANADPLAVLRATQQTAEPHAEPANAHMCVRLRARSMAQRALGDYDAAVVSIEAAERLARSLDDAELEAQCLISHAPLPAFAGRVAEARAMLDQASALAPGRFAAEIAFQRAGIAALVADWRRARDIYTEAIELFEPESNPLGIADALMTRGLTSAYGGDMSAADGDFDRARSLFRELDDTAGLGLVQWNRALSLLVNGEAAAAVVEFEAARAVFATTTYPSDELLGDLSEAYFTVGLEQEAVNAAADCVATFYPDADRSDVLAARDLGSTQNSLDAASRTLELARALAMTGALDAARVHGDHARAQFQLHGQLLRARRAEALLLSISLDASDPLDADPTALRRLADEAITLAAEWESSADIESRGEAELVSCRAAVAAGDHERARLTIARLEALPLTFRHELERAEHIAAIAIADGDVDRGSRTVLQALDAVRDRQLLAGSSFVAAAQSRRLERLVAVVVPPVLCQGDADTVVQLIERADLSPRTSGANVSNAVVSEALAALHTEYRSIVATIDEALSNSQDTSELQKRQGEIELRIRRAASSTMATNSGPLRLSSAPICRYVEANQSLWALEGRDGEYTPTEIGPIAPIRDLLDKVNRQVRLQFERPDKGRLLRITAMAHALDDMFGAPGGRDDETVHIIPSATLPSFPWGLLESLADRPWLRAARGTERSTQGTIATNVVGLIAGSDLASARDEVLAIAAVHSNAIFGDSTPATVEATLNILASCDLAHIAAHATVNPSSPMFSSLTLADGELSLYELEGLPTKPTAIVIASCRSAEEQRVGTTGVGIATALLHSGAELVIGAAVELPDSAAMTAVMVALHRQLLSDRLLAVHNTVQSFEAGSTEWLIASCLTPCVGEPWPPTMLTRA